MFLPEEGKERVSHEETSTRKQRTVSPGGKVLGHDTVDIDRLDTACLEVLRKLNKALVVVTLAQFNELER